MEQFSFGLSVALIGILVVFVGLAILICFIKILTLITTSLSGERKAKKAASKEAKETVPVMAAPAAKPTADAIPADVIAAITAAIACVWEGKNGFVVRHVKRVSNAPAWNRAGREEQTYSRF